MIKKISSTNLALDKVNKIVSNLINSFKKDMNDLKVNNSDNVDSLRNEFFINIENMDEKSKSFFKDLNNKLSNLANRNEKKFSNFDQQFKNKFESINLLINQEVRQLKDEQFKYKSEVSILLDNHNKRIDENYENNYNL